MAASGQPCPETTVISNEESLSPEWRSRLHDLVKATSKPGFPWSCTGARLSLTYNADGTGVVLRVVDRHERSAERLVRLPADLVPTGQALLASTELVEAEAAHPDAEVHEAQQSDQTPFTAAQVEKHQPPHANPSSSTSPITKTPLSLEPRVLIGVLATGRYTGPLHTLWGGVAIRGSIPFGDWSVALQGRFELPTWIFGNVPIDFSISEMSIGLGIGRRFVRRPFELHTVLDLSMNVVTMEGGNESNLAQASGMDPRVGLAVRTVWPLGGRWRFIVALDGEMAPLAIVGSDDRKIDDALPPLPSYTLGLSLGVEMGLK